MTALCVCGSARAAAPPPGATEVEGRTAQALLARPNASFRAYAFHGGVARPIPFQVDERDDRRRFATEHGPSPMRDDSPGVFDENDVIVFMNRDLGERGTRRRLPAGAAAWIEVRVGASDDPLGFVYVGAFAGDPPPPCATDYVDYAADRDEISAERYHVVFGGQPLPSALSFVRGKGEPGRNVLEGVRARGEARILGGLIKLHRTERDLFTVLEGYRAGPVRVIRHAKYWIGLPLGFKARAKVDLLFHRDFVEGRAAVKISIPPRLIPADGDLAAWFDFRGEEGARVLLDGSPPSEPVDGRMSDAKRRIAGRPARWAALLLPDGQAFLLAVRLEGSLRRLDQQLYFGDSPIPGASGAAVASFGFKLGGVNRLDTGEQPLFVTAMLVDSTQLGDIQRAASLLLSPPETAASPIP